MDEKYSLEEEKTIKTGLITLLAVLLISFDTISHNASIKSKGTGGKYNIYARKGCICEIYVSWYNKLRGEVLI